MIHIRKTDVFARWLDSLRDIVILLAGGNKKTQDADIKTALRLAKNL